MKLDSQGGRTALFTAALFALLPLLFVGAGGDDSPPPADSGVADSATGDSAVTDSAVTDSAVTDSAVTDSARDMATELTDLTTSSSAPLTPAFAPAVLMYQLSVPFEESETTVTATAFDPTSTITIDGTVTGSGVASSPIALDLGANLIDVDVTGTGGASATYQVEVTRGAMVLGQVAYVKASNTDAFDQFGENIALSGDTLVVGVPGESSDATGIDGDQTNNDADQSGAVYVFRRTGGTWAQEAYIKASNAEANDEFGYSVAISGDTLVVGAWKEDSNATGVGGDQSSSGADAAGAAYVFVRTGTTWTQEAYLKASNTARFYRFGGSVAISGDTVAVGSPRESGASTGVGGDPSPGSSSSGAVYVFKRTGTTWAQEAYVKASNTGSSDHFGTCLALSGDTLAVGAPDEMSNATGIDGDESDDSLAAAGAVYVFERTGTAWAQEAYVKASNTEAQDTFASSVALSGDTLAVGAWRDSSNATGIDGDQSNNDTAASGAVYVFERTGTAWAHQAYVTASNTAFNAALGHSVALVGDLLVAGAWGEPSNATGVNGDQTDTSAQDSGAVYVFRRTGTTWAQEAYVKASNTEGTDQFGIGVALSGETVVVGANQEESNATGIGGDQTDNSLTRPGALYIFE